ARPQVTSVDGYDIFRGTFSLLQPGAGDPTLSSLACIEADHPQSAVGSILTAVDANVPPPNSVLYYLVGHSSRAAGALDPLGKGIDGSIRLGPPCP
ncbi:MAG: hypothetical protein O7A63_01395, partial [Acidobacteria bacterium]|nr:hypothetical protein [Acidobacteriota bacterium]